MAVFKLSLGITISGDSPVEEALPLVRRAMERIGYETQARWRNLIQQDPKIRGEWREPYQASIALENTGPLRFSIYSDWKYAYEIENGRPSRDLKRMLDTSLKVRVSTSKNNAGKRYLIIPFRHNVDSMPSNVQKLAQSMRKSSVPSMGRRLSGTGAWDVETKAPALVAQRKYKWGDRLPAGLALKQAPHHKTDRYAGMVRFNADSGKSKSSVYLTFRTMMEGSAGWITKPVPGCLHIPQLEREIETSMRDMLTTALKVPVSVVSGH